MSTYTDAKNNTYIIMEHSLVSDEEQSQAREEVIEELYNIFTHK